MTFLLKKIFGLREKLAHNRGNPHREMPFLEHLEELRETLFKILVCLLVAVIAAFAFHRQFFELMRAPVEMAGLGVIEENHLPPDLSRERWKTADRIARACTDLRPEDRDRYLETACGEDTELREYAEALLLFRAATTLPAAGDGKRFLESTATDRPAVQEKALKLFASVPHFASQGGGNLIIMSALGPTEGFTLSIKLSFFAGLVLAFPFIAYFTAQFILPGLTPREKKVILPYLLVGVVLFAAGALFCYYVVCPRALKFFHFYNLRMGVASEWRIGYYVSFVTKLTLGFGVSFQLPVVVMILVALDLISADLMRRTRGYAVIIIVTIAAIITPTPDVLTLAFLAAPMVLLYEISIWVAWFMQRKRRLREAEEEAERAVWREKRRTAALEAAQDEPAEESGHPPFPIDENAYPYPSAHPEDHPPEPDPASPVTDHSRDQTPPPEAQTEYEEGFEPPELRPAAPVPHGEPDRPEAGSAADAGAEPPAPDHPDHPGAPSQDSIDGTADPSHHEKRSDPESP